MRKDTLNEIPEKLIHEAAETLHFGLGFYDEYYQNNDNGILKQAILNLHLSTTSQKLIRCFYLLVPLKNGYTTWRPHGDSNPGYRRERAMS